MVVDLTRSERRLRLALQRMEPRVLQPQDAVRLRWASQMRCGERNEMPTVPLPPKQEAEDSAA